VERADAFNTTLTTTIDNESGKASIDVGLLTDPATYVTSISDVAVFSFTAVAEGDAYVYISDSSNASAHGEFIISSRLGTSVSIDPLSEESEVDTINPEIAITNPSSGETVSGTVDFKVSASDNVGISSVQFSVDNEAVSSDDSEPFSYSIDTSKLSDGEHTLTAEAIDTSGNSAKTSVSIDVNNDGSSSEETTCTSFDYTDWGECQSDGTQTRKVTESYPDGCTGGDPDLSQSCDYQEPASDDVICTRFKYSKWGVCIDGVQSRTVTSSYPSGCVDGDPILTRTCRIK